MTTLVAPLLLLPLLLLLAGVVNVLPPLVDGYNYCNNKKLCEPGLKHFMCAPKSIRDAESGKYKALVPMTNKLRTLFLKIHNKYRDDLAGGIVTNGHVNYPRAARMRNLIWDGELEHMAAVHAAQCSFQHDKCHNSKRFPLAGQNLGFTSGDKAIKITDVIRTSMDAWFKERNVVEHPYVFDDAYITATHSHAKHFAVLANDRVSRFGCAVAYCACAVKHCYYMTCNYDMTNVEGSLVYLSGEKLSAQKCQAWKTHRHKKYKYLCHNTGAIFRDKTP